MPPLAKKKVKPKKTANKVGVQGQQKASQAVKKPVTKVAAKRPKRSGAAAVAIKEKLSQANTSLKTSKISSKGQITISADARKHLGIVEGTNLLEIVTDNCIVYIPQQQVLNEIIGRAKAALDQAGVSVEELQAEAAAIRQKRFEKKYSHLLND